MPEGLKTFINRCRCCLGKFYHDEKASRITNFFQIQFLAFTQLELQESDFLSHYVCEFCHSELLRFSVFKKDLIEKQLKLCDLLRKHEERVKEKKAKRCKRKEIEAFENIEKNLATSEKFHFDNENSCHILDDDEKSDDEDVLIVPANQEVANSVAFFIPLKRLLCDFCGREFIKKNGLVRHVKSHAKNSASWNQTQFGNLNIKSRKKKKIKKQQSKCDFPESHPSPEKKVQNTETMKNLNGKLDFVCFCGVSFKSAFSLRAHRNRLHGSRNKCTFGCVNLQFVNSRDFLQHVQNNHPECLVNFEQKNLKETDKFYFCDKCDFKGLTKSSMRSHLKSHLPTTKRYRFKCKVCSILFKRKSALQIHLQTFHVENHIFSSMECSQSTTKQREIFHKKRKKSNAKFKCEKCLSVFSKKSILNRHKSTKHLTLLSTLTKLNNSKKSGSRKYLKSHSA